MKKTQLSWHQPAISGDCPHCGKWQDFFEQFHEGGTQDIPYFESMEEEELEHLEFNCKFCDKWFGVDSISY